MIPRHPFDRVDLPRAEANIDAPVATVFGLLDDIPAWPRWLAAASGDVQALTDSRYEVDLVWAGRRARRRLEITARGPTHTLFIELVDLGHLYVRTRPAAAGTHLDVVFERNGGPRANPFTRRRRRAQEEAWLQQLVRDLDRHAGGATRPGGSQA